MFFFNLDGAQGAAIGDHGAGVCFGCTPAGGTKPVGWDRNGREFYSINSCLVVLSDFKNCESSIFNYF